MFDSSFYETDLYNSLFSIEFLTRFGYYDSITKNDSANNYAQSDSFLIDIFNMDSLADYIQDHQGDLENLFFSDVATGNEITEPISFSIPKNLISRREYKMPNIYSYLQLAYYVTLNKNKFVDAFNENMHSTSKYFNQLKYNYTVTQKIREGQLADDNNILNMDLGNFYHSLYTHTISWMLMGRNESKKYKRGGFSNTLDHLIQQEQFGETYGVPVGNLISRIITELYMCNFDKQIDSAFEGGVRFTRYVDDFHYTFTNESQKDAFVQRFRFLCREYRLNVNEYKTTVDTFPYLTSLDKDSIFHYFDNKFQGEQISEKLLKQSIITFIDLCLKEESQGNKGSIKSCFSVLNNFLEKIIKQKRLSKKSINALFTNDENLTNFNLFEKLLSLSLHDSKLSNLFIRFSKKIIKLGIDKNKLDRLVQRYFLKNNSHLQNKILFYKNNDYNQETYQIFLYLVYFNINNFFTRDGLLDFIDDNFDDFTICLSIILFLREYKLSTFLLLHRLNILFDVVNEYYNTNNIIRTEVMAQKHWLLKYFFYDLVNEGVIKNKKIRTYYHKYLKLPGFNGGGHKGFLNQAYALQSVNQFKANSFFAYLLQNKIHLVSFGKNGDFQYM